MTFRKAGCMIPLALLLTLPSLCKESKQASENTLSYDQCLKLALQAHPELSAARHKREAVANRARQTNQFPNPELEMELENIYGSGPLDGLDEMESTILIAQRLEVGGKRSSRKHLTEIGLTLSDLEVQETRQRVTRITQELFARALQAQESKSLAQEELELRTRFFDMVHQLLDAGAVPESDYRKARMDQVTAEIQLERADANRVQALNELAALWNGSPSDDVRLNDDIPIFDNTVQLPDTYPTASTLNLILNQQKNEKEAAVRLSKKLRIPDITLKAGYKRFAGIDEHAYVAGVSLELPVFNTGKWAVATARSNLLATEAGIRQERVRLRTRYQTLVRLIRAAEYTVGLLKDDLLPTAETEVNATMNAYKAGQYSYLQVIDSVQGWIDARRKLLDARFNRYQLLAELAYLVDSPASDGGVSDSSD